MSIRRVWQVTLSILGFVMLIPGIGLGVQHGGFVWVVVGIVAAYMGLVFYLIGWRWGLND